MPGLEIRHKREYPFAWILILLVICTLFTAAGWYAYRWYMTGEVPPMVKAQSGDPEIDETPVTKEEISQHIVPADHPRYISIPAINVSQTRVLSVGVTSAGQLDVPDNIDDAAWYDKSALPGSGYGAVLIDGHNGGISRNGVFAKLGMLQKGDTIVIERGDGKKLIYKVIENQSMSLDEVNNTGMKMMMQSADPEKEGLNIITCDGKWIPRLKQFDARIMLRSVRIE
ncbi:MAG: class F sortase [Candidatus Saccharimonadales bacterium]